MNIEKIKNIVDSYYKHNDIFEDEIEELEKLLKEIEKLKEDSDFDHKEYRRMLRDKEKELETYKKIAKLLSKELITHAELLEKDYGCYSMFAYNSPKEVIKWARNEVENDE